MNPVAEALKRAAIHVCGLRKFHLAKFMGEWGLEALLLDADQQNYSAKELAARVLAECCVTDGKFNNFQVGLLTVFKFLNDQFGESSLGQVQQFRDLLGVLNGGGSYSQIMAW